MLRSYRSGFRQIRSYSSRSKWKPPVGYSTGLKIYNRLANDSVDLVTRNDKICSWYCCGPTVYDSPHLGHACSYMQFDIIRRVMENFHGLNVVMIMSVTDVDDKIIGRANAKGVDFKEVAIQYEQEFFDSMSRLSIQPPTLAVRVSQHIPEIISFVSTIINNGLGYVAKDGSVYFAANDYPNYGKMVPAQEGDTVAGKSNVDFALWKASKPGEPSWESPWGRGRPGWHIECSAMASKYIGGNIDIHSGGIDLLFPHHENEEAQSCVYHGCDQWVNYWIHSGHLYLRNNVKMSKSLKNTVSISSFLQDYSPDHLRTLCMLVPYRNGVEYSRDVMVNATSVHDKIANFLSNCDSFVKTIGPKRQVDDGVLLKELEVSQERIRGCLSNDFNSSGAMSELLGLITRTTSEMNSKTEQRQSTSFSILAVANFVSTCLGKLGFFSNNETASQSLLAEEILQCSLNLRTSVKDIALSKNLGADLRADKASLLSACDTFRTNLKNVGISVKDGSDASTWSYGRSGSK